MSKPLKHIVIKHILWSVSIYGGEAMESFSSGNYSQLHRFPILDNVINWFLCRSLSHFDLDFAIVSGSSVRMESEKKILQLAGKTTKQPYQRSQCYQFRIENFDLIDEYFSQAYE